MKLVRENIEFKRDQSITKALDIGRDAYMKSIEKELLKAIPGARKVRFFPQYKNNPPTIEISPFYISDKKIIDSYKKAIGDWIEENTDLQVKLIHSKRHPQNPPMKSIIYQRKFGWFKITLEPF